MTQTVIAIFDSNAEAEQAAHHLAMDVSGVRGEVYHAEQPRDLGSLLIPAEDVATMSEAVRRGGAIVYAQVPDHQHDAVVRILEADGAVDINEREAAWQSEGWSGRTATSSTVQEVGAAEARSAGAAADRMSQLGSAVTGQPGTEASAKTSIEPGQSNQVSQTEKVIAETDIEPNGRTESIPLAEERISVGKRDAGRGTVRVRSYVVETPVQEQVTLHREDIQVERRTADRPTEAADDALFRERVIEATETSEEAVVSKEVRITEEVVVSKTAAERTQTISDTVRRTEVEVEREQDPINIPQRPDRY